MRTKALAAVSMFAANKGDTHYYHLLSQMTPPVVHVHRYAFHGAPFSLVERQPSGWASGDATSIDGLSLDATFRPVTAAVLSISAEFWSHFDWHHV
jgi:hypothetical protein